MKNRIIEKFESGRFWINNGKSLVLKYQGAPQYEVDIDRLKTAHQICNWLAQLKTKSWARDEVIADFVRTVHDTVNLYEIN